MPASRIALIALLLRMFIVPGVCPGQDEGDEEQPVKTARYSGMFGIGGGVSPIWMFTRTEALNAALTGRGLPEIPKDGMFLLGGHGYAYIMIIPNVRIGGMGAAGSQTVERIVSYPANPGDPSSAVQAWLDRTSISTGFGGVTIEYVFPFRRLHFAVGALLGAGSSTLTLTHLLDGDRTWRAPVSHPTGTEYHHVYENAFFAYQPMVSIEYLFSPFTVLSLTGGYYGSSGTSWTLDDAFTVTDMPDIRIGGPFVRLGLTFGLFIPE